MAIELTENAIFASQATGKTPVIILKFNELDTLFGPVTIKKYIRIGDPDLEIGDDWVIGGFNDVEDQKPYVQLSFSTSVIRQQIEPDRSSGASISSMKVRLVDYRQELTQLITPGNTFTDALGQRVTVYFGFQETAWPEDYIVVFRGVLEGIDAGPGWVEFGLNHPDELKRTTLFDKFETKLDGAINNSTTTITLEDTSGLIVPADALRSFIKIDNEFIEFTGYVGPTLAGVVRGALFATDQRAVAASHSDETAAEPFYILEDGTIDLALKLMLSQGPASYGSAVEIESFSGNEILFLNQALIRDSNVSVGDLITTTGATNPANNITAQEIQFITETDDGTVVEVLGAAFTAELVSPAIASFASQYNVLPVGAGMLPIDVDIAKHVDAKETFLAGYQTRHYVSEPMKLKAFIEEELYNPIGAFTLPRAGKASMGLHIPPLPGRQLVFLDWTNITNPSGLVVSRSTNQNFQNAIVYKIDRDLYEEKFRKGVITTNVQSISEIGKRRDYTVESNGLRTNLNGTTIASSISGRRLERYNRGSEFVEKIKLTLKDGMRLEPGDIVIFDPTGLSLVNTIDGTRERPAQFWEVTNRDFNLKGEVTVDIVQTNYQSTNRYGQISPASYIASGNASQVVIQSSFQSRLGSAEYRKWEDFVGAQVRVRNSTFTVDGLTTIQEINANVITFGTPLSFTPLAGYLMEFADYDDQTNLMSETVKLVYGFVTDADNPFADGGEPYRII